MTLDIYRNQSLFLFSYYRDAVVIYRADTFKIIRCETKQTLLKYTNFI